MNTIELIVKLKKYTALLRLASRLESEAHTIRLLHLEPHVETLKARLGLPSAPQNLPDFWIKLEEEHTFAALALTFHLLVDLEFSCAHFEATAHRLGTTNPDAVFLELFNAPTNEDFSRN